MRLLHSDLAVVAGSGENVSEVLPELRKQVLKHLEEISNHFTEHRQQVVQFKIDSANHSVHRAGTLTPWEVNLLVAYSLYEEEK